LLRVNGAEVGSRCFVRGTIRIQESFDIALGNDVFINAGCTIDASERVTIGDRVQFGPNVTIITGDHHIGPHDSRCGAHRSAPVSIGPGSWLGASSVVLPGVVIGPGAVVAAGAVVSRDVPADSLVAGVPARVIRLLDEPMERSRADASTIGG
jgi:maltose O-acetyltransferase